MAEIKTLDQVIRRISKEVGDIAHKGVPKSGENDTLASFGSISLDFCCYGGMRPGRFIEFSGAEGSGKAQPNFCEILTPTGSIKFGEVKVGDEILGIDGKSQKVVGVFPQGIRKYAKVTLDDGSFTHCDYSHIWRVMDGNHQGRGFRDITLAEILEVSKKDLLKRKVFLPKVSPIEYSEKKFKCDPYVLGAFLGDGCCKLNQRKDRLLTISSGDQEIPDEILKRIGGYKHKKNGCNFNWNFYKENGKPFSQSEILPEEVCGKGSYDKYIPEEYFYGSVEQRLDLLRGLMDTDGSQGKFNTDISGFTGYKKNKHPVHFSSVSKQLAEGIVKLARSLGMKAGIRISHRVKVYRGVAKEKISYQVRIGSEILNPFKLSRKAEIWLPREHFTFRKIVKVEDMGEIECTCIKVSNQDEMYLTNDYIPTHNTSVACLAAAAYQRANPSKSVLFVDIEGTLDSDWANKLGLKTDSQFVYYETVGQSGEIILNDVVDFIKTGEIGFVIIDSLPLLIPAYVQDEDNLEQKSMGGNAKLLSDFTSRYTGLVRKNKVIVIGINQLRDNMTGYGDPFKTTGGRAWKHACSERLMFKRGDFFDQEGEKVKKKDAQNPAGHYIEMYVLKNKDCPWDRKLGFTKLHYWKGIDYVSDLVEVATYFNLVDNSTVGWYKVLDEEGKPVLDDKGNEVKINGKKKFSEYLKEHREVSGRLYQKVKEMMVQKGATYIKGFEELLEASTQFIMEADENE